MRPIFDSLARARKAQFIMKVWQNTIAETFEERVRAIRAGNASNIGISPVILAQQLAGTLITLIVWWMDRHYPFTERVMDEQFHRLIAELR